MKTLVVTFDLKPRERAIIDDALQGAAGIVYLTDFDDEARTSALRSATVLLARDTGKDLREHETALVEGARLIQFVTAGVDFIPLSRLPRRVPVASNGGAYAEPMAEHAWAMILAAAKRLFAEHAELACGRFNQNIRNRTLSGGVCGILGFGGIGAAVARVGRALGMRIHAINRRGATDEQVDWIGTPDQVDLLLGASDVLVISTPLTRATQGLVDAQGLARMKDDAILVNLARGEIIDEAALFTHLQSHPGFTACIDAWWVEPVRHGTFRMDHPFLALPNVIGSPHNSASTRGSAEAGLRRAVGNLRLALSGRPARYLVGEDERLL